MKSVVFLRLVTVVLVVFSAPLFAVDVFEDFENGPGGFWEDEWFSVSDGDFVFRGDGGTNTTRLIVWNGGSNPGGWAPEPNNSNYFKDFNVSVNAVWLGGANDSGYGLSVCNQKDRFGFPNSIRFLIDGAGESWYTIERPHSEGTEILIHWKMSSLITPNASNHLSIAKQGNEFRFYINNTEVERLVINGYVGGSIGVEASKALDAAFDNFRIEPLDSSLPQANIPPTAAFSISTKHGEAPLTVTLDASSSTDSDGTIVGYNWIATDGQERYTDKKLLNMTFSNVGTYTISLLVTDDNGAQSTVFQKTVTVTAKPVPKVPPVAHLIVYPTNGEAPLTVSLNGSGSTDADGTIVKYAWKASDGQQAVGKNSKITFDNSGSYTIILTITDNDGLTDSAQSKVTVTAKPVAPVANLTVYPTNGEAPLTVSLNGSGSTDSDGTIVEYAWKVSNGQQAYGANTEIIFSHSGTYDITLTVKDNDGLTDTAQSNVTVTSPPLLNVPPTAAFSIYPTEGEAPLTVTLDASGSTDSDGTIAEYNWMTTDGQEHNTKKKRVNMNFSNVGTYTISLIVKDNDGAESVAVQQTVTVTDNVTVEKPDTGDDDDDKAYLEFIGLKDLYEVGETLVMKLVETADRDKYTRVDLWMAVQLPSEAFLFRTGIPMSPWSPQPQAHKISIENAETSHYIFDFELPEGMGGDYTLYAVYVEEGENPVTNGFSHRSNLVIRQIFLADRKD